VTTRATRREWIGLAIIALPCGVYAMDLTVLYLAVPSLSADLQPSSTQLLWIMDIYGFLVAGCLVTMGTLGDRVGRRRIMLWGAAAFAVTSVVAAFAPTADLLVAARAALGVAGATVAPSTLSLIRNMFHNERQRTFAIGVWIAAFSAGAAIGPVVGGVLIEFFWWGSVFLLAVPVMVILLVLGPRFLPEYRDPAARPLDLASAALSLFAVLAVIYGVKRLVEHDDLLVSLAAILFGIVLAVIFVRRQRGLAHPHIELSLFAAPAFRASLGVYAVIGLVMFGIYYFIPQYFQLVAGLSPLSAALWTSPGALAFVVGSMWTARWVARFGRERTLIAGQAVAAAGLLATAFVTATDSVVLLAVASVVASIGFAPVITIANDLIVGTAPPERAGAASGVAETCGELSGALGVALFGTLGVGLYRAGTDASLATLVTPSLLAEMQATLGGAVGASARLDPVVRDTVLAAAREAFVDGMQATAWICGSLTAATAVFAARWSAAFRMTAAAP